MDIGNLIFMILKNDIGENFIIIDCDVKCLCGCISDIIKNQQIVLNIKYFLLIVDEFSDFLIEESDVVWLREEFEILYFINFYIKC